MENRLLVRRKFRHKTCPREGGVGEMSASSIGFRHGITSCFACRSVISRVSGFCGCTAIRITKIAVRNYADTDRKHFYDISTHASFVWDCWGGYGIWGYWRRCGWGLGIWRRVVWCFLTDVARYRGAFIFKGQVKVFFNIHGEWTTVFRNVGDRLPNETASDSSRPDGMCFWLQRKVLKMQESEIKRIPFISRLFYISFTGQ